MKTLLLRTVALLAVACTAGSAHAADATDAAAARIKEVLTKRFPDVKVERVLPAPVTGLYEVDTATDIVYTDATGEHLIMGNILETQSQANLTALRWDERNTIDFSTLPLNLAIKNVRGDGSRVMAVFSDPHCPFCQKLEKELEQVDNTTVYTFLFPIEGLHHGATQSAHALWCSADRPGAWKKWMLSQQSATAAPDCTEDPVATIQALGDRLKIQSTPTVFLANGRRVTGALPAAELEQRLAATAGAKSTAGASTPRAALAP
jgi:thiol:disulfide interchange protein DsbC